MKNATQTDSDRALELISQTWKGLTRLEIYRELTGDTEYKPAPFIDIDPFGPEPEPEPDHTLDYVESLLSELKRTGKIERNMAGCWVLTPQFKEAQTAVQALKPAIPSPRAPEVRSEPQKQAQAEPKPARSEAQTRKGENHPGSATKNRPTRDDFTQNDHQWAPMRMDLTHAEVGVAMRLHLFAYGTDNWGGRGVFKAPMDTAADLCKMGRSTFSQYVAKLQEVGLFVRLDNAKGGRGNRNTIVLKPSLPAWYKKPDEQYTL